MAPRASDGDDVEKAEQRAAYRAAIDRLIAQEPESGNESEKRYRPLNMPATLLSTTESESRMGQEGSTQIA